jgi:predicted dehydrogenase
MTQPKRYAIVGTGGRSRMFVDAICQEHAQHATLVGLCDLSQTRMDWYNHNVIQPAGYEAVPTFHADRFDEMVRQTKPDSVIVTTMDSTHHIYIIRAMELGCDAISEKPMTTDEHKARAIFEAIERTGRHLRVTFNYRYQPQSTKVRELVMNGLIGTPLSVEFTWLLDTSHGADYFRRWHAEKEKSGGLLVHKATHHFDLINFWIGDRPAEVFCYGDLLFYGKANAQARGQRYDYERYTGQEAAKADPFALDLQAQENLKGLYHQAEAETGYLRDKNVFGEHVNIEDTMAVTARYRKGPILSYHLLAYAPWEGYRCGITGTRGRLDIFDKHGSHVIAGQSDDELAAQQRAQAHTDAEKIEPNQYIRVWPMFGAPYLVDIPEGVGGHGGGDLVMLEQIFDPHAPKDPFGRAASHLDGAASILTGCAANHSIASGQPVRLDDLLELPDRANVSPKE